MDTSQTPPVGGEIGSRIGVRFYRYRGVLKRYWWVLLVTVGVGLLYQGWLVFSKPERPGDRRGCKQPYGDERRELVWHGPGHDRESGGFGTSRQADPADETRV